MDLNCFRCNHLCFAQLALPVSSENVFSPQHCSVCACTDTVSVSIISGKCMQGELG